MKFFIGRFGVSDDADYEVHEAQFMREQLGTELIDDMLKYSTRAWKAYNNSDYYMYVEVYCEFDNNKRATWFQIKYPTIKFVSTDFA